MKRFAILFPCLMLLSSPAMATSDFSKAWRAEFLESENATDEFKAAAKKAGCYICHVKGEDKKEVRNEYGKSVQKYLKAEDFPKEYIKDKPEEAKMKILEGFKKANEHMSKDEKKFGDKIKNNELPATDAGL